MPQESPMSTSGLQPVSKNTKEIGVFHWLTGHEIHMDITADQLGRLGANRQLSLEDGAIYAKLGESLKTTGRLPYPWSVQEANYLRSEPVEKWLDYLIYRYKFKVYPAEKQVADFPVYVLIEPTSVCNLRCTVCFQVDNSFTVKPFMGLMDMDLYRRLIDEVAAGGTKAVTMASRGEPTLHPKLGEMLGYASEKFIDLKLNTNATRLTEKLCHQILESGVNELVFSIDSEVEKIYEEIRVKGKFTEILANVRRFRDIQRKQYPASKLNTRVSGVKFREDQNEETFKSFWSEYVGDVGFINVENRWDTYKNPVHPEIKHPCTYLWERMYVWYDGKVNPCDVDYKSELSPGSVLNKSIREVWHGEAYTKLREAHVAGLRGTYVPCDRCGV
jgi:MoaA/NifB/PqqE/SkfB family radical SAM enzyme